MLATGAAAASAANTNYPFPPKQNKSLQPLCTTAAAPAVGPTADLDMTAADALSLQLSAVAGALHVAITSLLLAQAPDDTT